MNIREQFAGVFKGHLEKLEARTGFKQYEHLKKNPDKLREVLTEMIDVAIKFDISPEKLDSVLKDAVLEADDKFIGINPRFIYKMLKVWSHSHTTQNNKFQEFERVVLTPEEHERVHGSGGLVDQYLKQIKESTWGTKPAKKMFSDFKSASVGTGYTSTEGTIENEAVENFKTELTGLELSELYALRDDTEEAELKHLIEVEILNRS